MSDAQYDTLRKEIAAPVNYMSAMAREIGELRQSMEQSATVLNLASLIEQHAIVNPGKLAVVYGDVRLTYKQLNDYANQIANGLKSLGIGHGDNVALSCPNLPYFPLVYYGILKTGATVVPLNILFKPREIAYHLKDSDAKAVFCFEGTEELPLAQMVKQGFDEVETCEHLIVITTNPFATTSIEGAIVLGELMKDKPTTFRNYPTSPDDTAVILYTSGTTGQPKGAELTHLNMTINAMSSREVFMPFMDGGLDKTAVSLITLPLFHSTGQTAQMNATFYDGSKVVLLPRFDAAAVLETIRKEKVSFWVGVPTMFWALLRYAEENSLDVGELAKTLRVTVSGGAPMPVELMKQFEEKFGVRVLEGYGLSETSPVACFTHPQIKSKPGTVGLPLFAVEIACVDENDNPVPTGVAGEIVIRGHNVMKGYYKREEATAEALRNGWFHTGDIGVFDEDGYLSIVDRKKDLIIRGGYNVYPRELEEVIMTHTSVSQVAVLGIPDERLGEEVKAFIVLKSETTITEEEMIVWLKSQIASNKYPRRVEFRDSLPISATGKILKRVLRDEIKEQTAKA
jgi:long-chain acyl-CoA synthetase